jgi:septum formation protein
LTRFLLASGSPRRRELFGLFRVPFDVTSADVDESPRDGETPAQMVARLSQAKVSKVGMRLPTYRVVIAADTIVARHFSGG